MPVPYCFISEPHSGDHITAAFAQMHVTAFNNSGANATVKASCTHDSTSHKHDFEDVVLGSDPDVVHLIVYAMPHKANGGTHTLYVEMKKATSGSWDSDTKDGIVMEPPDAPSSDVHNGMFYDYGKAWKAFNFDGHDYLPKKLLAGYPADGVFIKAKNKGKTTVEGEVKGGPTKLDLKMALRDPHLVDKGNPPAPLVLNQLDSATAGAKWATPVDTSTDRHGSVLTMEFTLDGKPYPVRFVLPVMDPAKKDSASKPDKGVYVFKIAKP